MECKFRRGTFPFSGSLLLESGQLLIQRDGLRALCLQLLKSRDEGEVHCAVAREEKVARAAASPNA